MFLKPKPFLLRKLSTITHFSGPSYRRNKFLKIRKKITNFYSCFPFCFIKKTINLFNSVQITFSRFKVQGFFICHIIVIQGITRSEMQSNQVRSVTVQNNKNTNYISNITQGHTYGKKRRNKNKMCNEIKKCKTIRCAKNNKMCKRQ